MGEHTIRIAEYSDERRAFLQHLLHDVQALDLMVERGLIEKGIGRIGAEQEFFLVDRHFKPTRNGPEILAQLHDAHFATELARYNLEINLDPVALESDCLRKMESQLHGLLEQANNVAGRFGDRVLLTGILPSIDLRAVELDYLTPNPRYQALGEIVRRLRGQDFELNIKGVDELMLAHTNILLEACNTSFQAHLQVSAEDFVSMYNWAQAISGPVLAICTNSPLLFGRELWSETRITLFQQSVDMRSRKYNLRERQQRVSFGSKWIRSVTEVYKDDISRYPLIFLTHLENDSLAQLQRGEAPDLKALRIHNGTIWKWNRPCYGVLNGKPHLRIENRYIPAGPTVADEMANLAFWVGLMKAMPPSYHEIWNAMDFEDAKENFYKAARIGLFGQMRWNNKFWKTEDLVLDLLLPMARTGLTEAGIHGPDIEHYLSIIESRVRAGTTGSRWMVENFRHLKRQLGREEATVTLTAAMCQRMDTQKPLHEWSPVTLAERDSVSLDYGHVGNVMSTDLVTARANDPLELVEKVMAWRHIRHLPVEDDQGNIRGIITRRRIEDFFSKPQPIIAATAEDIMIRDPICIPPSLSIAEAMQLMLDRKVSCLPVIDQGQLVGIVTEQDMTALHEKMSRQNTRPQLRFPERL
ncbi:MAG: glutamate-cysteine ligase family protein [Cyclobacteriaceae bacterium]|jgi:CBS domain-containing protein